MAAKSTTEPQYRGIKKLWKALIEAGTEDRSKELVPGRYLDIAHL